MAQLFEPRISYAAPTDPRWKRAIIRLIELLTGQPRLEKIYRALRLDADFAPESFWQDSLKALSVSLDYAHEAFDRIPKEGPLVVIANHPFGVLDGLTICHLASRMRNNFQILTNSVLCQDPALATHLLPVSFDETREAMLMNIKTKQQALQTLEDGGAIVIFPGGGISTAAGWRGQVTDLEWKRFAAKLIQLSSATVIPVYFHGQNSRLFQFVSQFSLTLRLALLLYEVNRMMGTTLQLEIGRPLPFAALAPIKDRQALLNHLREHVYNLAQRT